MTRHRFSQRATLLAVALFLLVHQGLARERGPRVEVVCPFPPTPVQIHDKLAMAYELHITNFDTVPLTLKRLDVFADTTSGQPIASLAEADLPAAMQRIGIGGKDVQNIEPGARAVVFMWVERPLQADRISSLRHRMIFASPRKVDTAGDLTLPDFAVAVTQQSPPLLSPPFRGGTWLAGGAAGNDSDHRRTIIAIDGHIYSPERFAIDWVNVGPNGDSHHDDVSRNENWWGYGEPVLAVADGEVTDVRDGISENTPRVLPTDVTLDNIAGNYVIVRIAPDQYATFAHLQNGSIKVRSHQRVARGEVLALLGNTGNATAPHLHFQLSNANSVLQSQGVPFAFAHFTYLGLGKDYELEKHVTIPWDHSIPPKDAVVEFK
jgi:murein DD-endopeptidase MepM/ murein hydrolase activator NlpD